MTSQFAKHVLTFAYPSPGAIIAAGAALPAVAIVIVSLRFYLRAAHSGPIGLDDWLVLPALLMVIAMGATMIAGVKERAIGYPTPRPTNETREDYLTDLSRETLVTQKVQFTMTEFLIIAYTFIKISIMFFYKRLFVTQSRSTFNYILWAQILINVLWCLAFFFAFLFGCGSHVPRQWNSNREDTIRYCKNSLKRIMSLYTSELIINVLLIITPIPAIWSLKMKLTRKLAIMGVMLLAFMAIAASIVRLAIVIQVSTKTVDTGYDTNQTISTLFYWGMIEGGLALITCCLPTLSVLFKRRSLQSAIRSARSILSIQSNYTHRTNSAVSANPMTQGAPPFGGGQSLPHVADKLENGGLHVDLARLRLEPVLQSENYIKAESVPDHALQVEEGRILIKKDFDLADKMI